MPQSLSKQYTHLVFATKGRTDTLPKEHIAETHAYIAGILNDLHCPAIIVGGTFNHIHILFVLSRTVSLSEAVRITKANSAKWLNEHNGLRQHFAWQDGYAAFSISQSHVEAVRQYIATQAEHHKSTTFQDEYRRLCNLYDAGLDEKYAWD